MAVSSKGGRKRASLPRPRSIPPCYPPGPLAHLPAAGPCTLPCGHNLVSALRAGRCERVFLAAPSCSTATRPTRVPPPPPPPQCLHCASYLQQRQAQCPLCRAPFCPSLQLAINCELRELMRLAEALTAVEGEDGWQAVTTAARLDSCTNGKAGGDAPCGGGGSAVRLRPRVGVGEVVDGSGSVMELDPQPWEPDSSSAACRWVGCGCCVQVGWVL